MTNFSYSDEAVMSGYILIRKKCILPGVPEKLQRFAWGWVYREGQRDRNRERERERERERAR